MIQSGIIFLRNHFWQVERYSEGYRNKLKGIFLPLFPLLLSWRYIAFTYAIGFKGAGFTICFCG
jgi:hypothetical protein